MSGPTMRSDSASNGVPATARRASVFFNTRRYTPCSRACLRNAVIAPTSRPRYSATTIACAFATSAETSATTPAFASRFRAICFPIMWRYAPFRIGGEGGREKGEGVQLGRRLPRFCLSPSPFPLLPSLSNGVSESESFEPALADRPVETLASGSAICAGCGLRFALARSTRPRIKASDLAVFGALRSLTTRRPSFGPRGEPARPGRRSTAQSSFVRVPPASGGRRDRSRERRGVDLHADAHRARQRDLAQID